MRVIVKGHLVPALFKCPLRKIAFGRALRASLSYATVCTITRAAFDGRRNSNSSVQFPA